jgi:hypothetical protein
MKLVRKRPLLIFSHGYSSCVGPTPTIGAAGTIALKARLGLAQTTAALVSGKTATSDRFLSDHLKLCFLWFDEVVFEELGEFNRERLLERALGGEHLGRRDQYILTDVLVPLSSKVPPAVNREISERNFRGYPRWGQNYEHYDYPHPEDPYEHAHNSLLRHIEREHAVARFTGYEVELAEGRARVAVDAVWLWSNLNRMFPCMLQADDDEKVAMQAARSFNAAQIAITPAFKLYETIIPSLDKVSWRDLTQLKKSGAFGALKAKITQVLGDAAGDLQAAQEEFRILEDQTTAEIVERFRPKTLKIGIEALLENLPVVPINPIGMYTAIRDFVAERDKARAFNWLYVLRELRGERKKVWH